jgi:hypothetical protein
MHAEEAWEVARKTVALNWLAVQHLEEGIRRVTNETANMTARHLEELLAAYFVMTDVPPQDAVLCHRTEWRGSELIQLWWVEHRDRDPIEPYHIVGSIGGRIE